MKLLDGATAIIRFELYHYLIRKGKDQPAVDTFSTRVVQVRIIPPPPWEHLPLPPERERFYLVTLTLVRSPPPSATGMMTMTRKMTGLLKPRGK